MHDIVNYVLTLDVMTIKANREDDILNTQITPANIDIHEICHKRYD